MGKALVDQYSLLHFAVGIIAYFWGISAWLTIAGHLLFELVENTEKGMAAINRWATWWPGGKPYADTVPNSIGDTVATMLGWWAARVADKMSRERHLYP
jgi:hypothetical protein